MQKRELLRDKKEKKIVENKRTYNRKNTRYFKWKVRTEYVREMSCEEVDIS